MNYYDTGLCLRKAQDMTAISSVHIATSLGVKPQQVARWRSNPNLKLHTIISLCEVLGMTLEDFLSYDR